jgi:uncharacterized protein (DUF58 family)
MTPRGAGTLPAALTLLSAQAGEARPEGSEARPSLIPAPIQSRARPLTRLPFAFAPRFFVALLLGLIWIIPAWWSPRLIGAMFLWDAFVLALWLVDLRRLPAPSQLEIRRMWSAPLSLAHVSQVRIELRNCGHIPILATIADNLPASLRGEPAAIQLGAAAGAQASGDYQVLPRNRGDIPAGGAFLRYQSSLGVAERWAVADLYQSVRVLPDLEQARRHALYLIRSRQVEMEKRRRRQRGAGREFESLREYRQGDEMRDICWPATARRHQLTTRLYQTERSQTVWIVLDAGRLLRAEVRDPQRVFRATKLDYAVDAALALAQVASQSGDRVGLLAYGRAIQQSVGAGRGPLQIRAMLDSLALVHEEAAEANHALAARTLLRMQSRRALIVWITDFAETPMTPEVIEYATQMTRRHVVVFAVMNQPDLVALARATPQDRDEMFRHTAALEVVERRELLLRGLRQRGVLAIDLPPGAFAAALVNQYLDVKERSLI